MEKSLSLKVKLSRGPISNKVYSFSRVNEDVAGAGAGEKGTLGFLLTLKSELEAEDLAAKAEETANHFEENYLSSKKGTILASLEDALNDLKSREEDELTLEVVVAVVWGPVLYVGRLGAGGITLYREGGAKAINFSFVASGLVGDGETICLGNSVFEQAISPDQLSLILGRESLEEVKKKLDEIQLSHSGSCCILIRVELKETEPPSTPISFVDTDITNGGIKLAINTSLGSLADKARAGSVFLGEKTKPLLDRLKPFVLKLVAILTEPWRPRIPGEIHDEKKRKRARIIQVGVGLALLLLLSVGISSVRSGQERQKKQAIATVSQIKTKLDQAKQAVSTDPQRAASLLTEVSSLIEKAKKGPAASKLSALQSELEKLLAENKRIYKPTQLAVVADLSKDKSKADLVALVDNSLISLSKANSQLLLTDLASGKTSTLSTSIESGQTLTSEAKLVYVTSKNSAWQLDRTSGSLTKILSGESAWGGPTDLAVYHGNLYVLDAAKGEVWKHVGSALGLSAARSYLTAEKLSLGSATSLAVDGSVWIGTKEGAVYQFLSGKKQDFRLRGGPETLAITKIFTNTETNNIYLLDTVKGRIVVFDKTGGYAASYEDPLLKEASGIVVSEVSKQIYFTVGSKIYKFKLR